MRPRICILLVFLLTACQESQPPEDFVARVGTAFLTQAELDARLASLAVGLDTIETRRQLIDQWVTSELLYQEAQRLRLETQTDVKDRINESERAVLIEALVSQLHEETAEVFTPGDVTAYFDTHKERMRLLEPFIRVRYLTAANRDSIEVAMSLLNAVPAAEADSVFDILVLRFASDPAAAFAVSQNYFPEARLFVNQPGIHASVSTMTSGSAARILLEDSTWHLLQLVDRAPAGSIPQLAWVEDLVRSQLDIETRKRNYLRTVQKLLMEAEAREEIEIR